ncbi:MAG: hypothetical protein M3033_03390 [Acidobacteriota bacterium]|nr:hypothetical protein [Acidobacteriota bacterium]
MGAARAVQARLSIQDAPLEQVQKNKGKKVYAGNDRRFFESLIKDSFAVIGQSLPDDSELGV